MPRILATTWTAQTLRFVHADAGARGRIRILEAGSAELPSADDGRHPIVNGIRSIVGRLKAEKSRLLVLVNRGSVDSASFDVPPATDAELPALVQNLGSRDIPAATEDTIIDYIAYPPRPDGTRSVSAMAMVAENQQLLKQLLEQTGCKSVRVLISTHPLRAFSPRITEAPTENSATTDDGAMDKADLIVSRGLDAADLLLCTNKVPILSRTLRLAPNVPDAEIIRYLRTEVQRTLITAGGQLPRPVNITSVVVIGNERQTTGLDAALSAQFQVAASVATPTSILSSPDSETETEAVNSGDFAPLLAAIVEEATGIPPAIDFANPRRPPVQGSRSIKLIAAGTVAALLVGAGGYYVWSQLNEVDEEIARLTERRNELSQLIKDTEGKRQLANALKSWESNRISWPDELKDLTDRIPSSPELTIGQLTVSPAGAGTAVATFRGTGKTPEVISQMEVKLRDKYHDIQIPAVREVQENNNTLASFQATLRIRSRPVSQFRPSTETPSAPTGAAAPTSAARKGGR